MSLYSHPSEAIMEAESARMKAAGEFVGIPGNSNCDDDCRGWDGNDRRCDCGNRRVFWEWEDTDEGIQIWPEVD